eukprot:Blabericola_migrator_1__952@NODE_123_length_13376_cov_72_514539_g109_i0_p5_GENE_NODE_123_length_13376_cov_72_514539_g109_i0NODE_123_length_13376_cov_72_514539_g109_i0_p5_ORF_typecomplete_len267_score50_54SoxG/PF04268_12/0_025_NODE_123_length_13376_cov_72_514539_g109_i0935910159
MSERNPDEKITPDMDVSPNLLQRCLKTRRDVEKQIAALINQSNDEAIVAALDALLEKMVMACTAVVSGRLSSAEAQDALLILEVSCETVCHVLAALRALDFLAADIKFLKCVQEIVKVTEDAELIFKVVSLFLWYYIRDSSSLDDDDLNDGDDSGVREEHVDDESLQTQDGTETEEGATITVAFDVFADEPAVSAECAPTSKFWDTVALSLGVAAPAFDEINLTSIFPKLFRAIRRSLLLQSTSLDMSRLLEGWLMKFITRIRMLM